MGAKMYMHESLDLIAIWVVVSNMFYFQPYLGR